MKLIEEAARAIAKVINSSGDETKAAQAAIRVFLRALEEPSEETAKVLYRAFTGVEVLGQEDNYSVAVPALRTLARHLSPDQGEG